MKLMSDYLIKLYSYKLEDLIKDFEQLNNLDDIQSKNLSSYEELLYDEYWRWTIYKYLNIIDKNDSWDAELRLMSDNKTNFWYNY